MVIDLLLMVEGELIAVPVAVHEPWVVVTLARVWGGRHGGHTALDIKAPLRPLQAVIVVAAEEIRPTARRLPAHVDEYVPFAASRSADSEAAVTILR